MHKNLTLKERLNQFVDKRRYLFWDVVLKDLSVEAIVERTLQYGDLSDIRELLRIIPEKTFKSAYLKVRNKTRRNLADRTVALWDNFLEIKDSKFYIE